MIRDGALVSVALVAVVAAFMVAPSGIVPTIGALLIYGIGLGAGISIEQERRSHER